MRSSRRIVTPQSTQPEQSRNKWFMRQHICVFAFLLAFVLVSAFIFTLLEDISYIDGLYFTIITQSTVGYGDITPQTNYGRVFNFFFIIISFGVIVILFNLLFDYWFDSKINELCTEIQDDINEIKLGSLVTVEIRSEQQRKACKKRLYILFYLLIYILWVIIWTLFFWLNPTESDFTFFESLYFAVVTSTTVGYGTFLPQSDGAKLFVFIFVYIGVMALAMLLSALSEEIINFVHKFEPKKVVQDILERREWQKEKLTALLSDYEVMTKHHYIVNRLLKTNKISKEEYEKFESEFKYLDKDGNEILDANDLKYFCSVDKEQNNDVDEIDKLLPHDK